MKSKVFILFNFITTLSFGQDFLPKKDTIVKYKDGSEIHYEVKPHAIFMDYIVDGISNGPHKAFYRNGKLWYEDNRVDNKIEGKSIEFTPKGDTAVIQEWKNSAIITKIIFYQSTPDDPQKYYFVSKTGFVLCKNRIYTKLDKTTPDSLIEEYNMETCIWLNGERKTLNGKNPPTYTCITDGDNPGIYKVQDSIKTFFRPFTKGEKEKIIELMKEEEKKKQTPNKNSGK